MATEGHIDFIVRGKIGDIPISPDAIELGLFQSFADDVATILKSIPDLKKNTIVVAVEEGSFKLKTFLAALAVNTMTVDAATLNQTNDLSSINSVRSKIIESWAKKSKANPTLEFEIRPNGNDGIKIDNNNNFKKDESYWVQSELYLYGMFNDLGGMNKPNIHFTTDKQNNILINCKFEDLQNETKNRVYQAGGVRVLAKQNLNTGEIKDASFVAFVEYTPSYNEEELLETIKRGSEAWQDVPDHVEWVRNLRNDE